MAFLFIFLIVCPSLQSLLLQLDFIFGGFFNLEDIFFAVPEFPFKSTLVFQMGIYFP